MVERVVAERFQDRVDAREGIEGHGEPDEARDQDHDRAEEVGHEGDPEGGGPAADLAGEDPVPRDRPEEHDAGSQEAGRPRERQGALQAPAAPGEERDDAGEHGEEDGKHQPEVLHESSASPIRSRSSLPTVR